uniref:Uncharacterized protein n=2 Tax=Panagrolaimus sp. JU765 TaxID=591449 RepID=A0AC34Q9C6_9BILA
MSKAIEAEMETEKLFNIQKHIDLIVGNIIMQLVFGIRYSSDPKEREEFSKLKSLIDSAVKDIGSAAGLILQNKAHRYKNWPILGTYYKRMMETKKATWSILEQNIENRRKEIDFDSDAEPIDYVEAFLKKQYEIERKGDENYAFTHEQLTGALWDMWIADGEQDFVLENIKENDWIKINTDANVRYSNKMLEANFPRNEFASAKERVTFINATLGCRISIIKAKELIDTIQKLENGRIPLPDPFCGNSR